MRHRSTSLLGLVFRRIAAFAALAMAIQLVVVTHEYWSDESKLVRKVISTEADLLAQGIRSDGPTPSFTLPAGLAIRYRHSDSLKELEANGYFVLITTADDKVLFTNCDNRLCQAVMEHDTSHMPDFWFHMLAPGKPLSFVGGRSLILGGEKIQVGIGVFNDPEGLIYGALWDEVKSHMLVPMSIMLLLIVGAATLSIRAALRPVLRASALAARSDPDTTSITLDTTGMTEEIAQFSEVINRNFRRIHELIAGQKLFASAISHEIRTPVSIVRLELEQIDHPRARKAIEDLDGLTHLLNQLTLLAKLDAVTRDSLVPVDLAPLVETVVTDMVPLVYARGKTIEFDDQGGAAVPGLPHLLENLVRNLIENSIKHTPPGTHIVVSTGPGAVIGVADDGPGMRMPMGQSGLIAGRLKLGDGVGIGLNIVTRIAAIHKAAFTLENPPGGGTRATLRFAPEAPDQGSTDQTAR